jgi:DNA polymerase-3 subunit alpha
MPVFSHLHVHTQYSLLDGAASIKSLVKKAKADGMPALAITDHGNMFGAFEFYQAVTAEGLMPVIGCEFYVVEDRFQKSFTQGAKDKRYHQLLLAKNQKGYANLSKLCSLGYLEGLYSKYPRVDRGLIEQYSEGLIATTCCIGAQVPQAILWKGEEEAEKIFCDWHRIFGDDYYIELQRHGLENLDGTGVSQEDINQTLLKFGKKYNVHVIATNDSHYTEKKDANAHDILLCINTGEFQSTPKATNEDGGKGFRFAFPNDEFFFKTQDEMAALFHDIPEALDNTNRLISTIEPPKLSRDIVLPNYELPMGFDDQNVFLKHLAYAGCKKRYGGVIPLPVQERLDFELNTITHSGFAGYFLIVQDFTTAAREMDVWVGPGRGSAAGSLVAYCLGITNVDPVKYDLLFERFLNPERVSMPDVDIDFDDQGRDRVIQYVAKKYGERRIAQIITYGTMAAKSAIRDVGRVLQYPLQSTDRLSKLVVGNLNLQTLLHANPDDLAKDDSKNLKPEEIDAIREIQKVYQGTDDASKVLRDAEKLEGSVRNTGVHACGIIIAPQDIEDLVPVALSKESQWIQVQYDVNQIEKAGLLKMDFLGLSTLTIMKDAIQLIKETTGDVINLDSIPLDDPKTYELFQRGDTNGVFQFESPGMQKYMRELKPTQFGDLIAMNALYRPGPLKYIPDFIDRKHGRKPVEFDLPEMEDYLKETYGITVYQEQVMLLSQKIAGFSKGKADELRKAMGKKNKSIIDKLKGDFMAGAMEKGFPEKVLEKIYSDWEEFAQYAFNKSHSTCYAVIAFQTAYLKANYPAQFMAAVLKSNMGDIKKITFYMEECHKQDIKVLGPDLNESRSVFTVTKSGQIRFGLSAVKGVSEVAVNEILKERDEKGVFKSLFDLSTRVNLRSVGKRTLESMAKAGVFDFDPRYHRAQYVKEDSNGVNGIELAVRYGTRIQHERYTGQMGLFGGGANLDNEEPKLPQVEKMTLLEELKEEEELVGVFLSKHPLDDFKFVYESIVTHTVKEYRENLENKTPIVFQMMGIITSAKEFMSQKGNPYARFNFMDYTGTVEISIFTDKYLKFKNLIDKDYILLIQGQTDYSKAKDEMRLNINAMQLVSDIDAMALYRSVHVEMTPSDLEQGKHQIVSDVLSQFPGKCPLYFNFYDAEDNMTVRMVSKAGLNFVSEVREMLDEMEVKYAPKLDDRWLPERKDESRRFYNS